MRAADVPLLLIAVLVAANLVVYGRNKVIWLVLGALILVGTGLTAILLAMMTSD